MCGEWEIVLRGDLRPPLQGLPKLFRVWGISGCRRRAPQAHILDELEVASRVSWEALVRPPGSCVSNGARSLDPGQDRIGLSGGSLDGSTPDDVPEQGMQRVTVWPAARFERLPFARRDRGSLRALCPPGRGLAAGPGRGCRRRRGGGCRDGVRKKFMIVCHRGVYLALAKGEGTASLVLPDRGAGRGGRSVVAGECSWPR